MSSTFGSIHILLVAWDPSAKVSVPKRLRLSPPMSGLGWSQAGPPSCTTGLREQGPDREVPTAPRTNTHDRGAKIAGEVRVTEHFPFLKQLGILVGCCRWIVWYLGAATILAVRQRLAVLRSSLPLFP